MLSGQPVVVSQTPEASAVEIHDEESSVGAGIPPAQPSGDEYSDIDVGSDMDDLLLEEAEQPEFSYTLMQKAGQFAHDVASSGVVVTAIAPFLSLTPSRNYLFVALGYKIGCDSIQILRALTAKTYPLDGLRADGNGSLGSGITRTGTIKVVSWAVALSVGIGSDYLLDETTDHPDAHQAGSLSIHDVAARAPLIGIAGALFAKGAEVGLKAIEKCIAESTNEEIERYPELSKWQVLGGYSVKSVVITAAGSTVFLYEMYAGEIGTAMNQDLQTLNTLAAIVFFNAFDHLAFVPRPLACLKVEDRLSVFNEPQRLQVAMTNGEIMRMVGLNAVKECFSLGMAYEVARLCRSLLLPVMHHSETFAPAQDEMEVYTEQMLLASITTAFYFGVKFALAVVPAITNSCVPRVTGLWGSMWSRPGTETERLMNEREQDLESTSPGLG